MLFFFFFFFKQKTAYEIVSGDWSSDVCSSDLSPGSSEVTTGCLVARACFEACWLGELSQHSVAPHCWQVRRCTHCEPILTHSAHSRRLPCRTVVIASRCSQLASAIVSLAYSCSTWWTAAIAIDPSPTADAARLTLPLRTSPTANTPGRLVSRICGERARGQCAAARSSAERSGPVLMKPRASSARQPWSHAVLGLAPVMEKMWRMPCVSSRPDWLSRQVTRSR